MKKYQIVVDSSSDLTNDYINDENVALNIVPLTIHVGDKEFVDEEGLDIPNMLVEMRKCKTKSTSSCPSVGKFLEIFEQAENSICITMTGTLSGTNNAARVASSMTEKKVGIVDSKSTSGVLVLLVDKCYELMKQNKSIDEINEILNKEVDNLNLLFVLDNFDNLIKNGRMSKASAIVAGLLKIKPIATAFEGEIKLIDKQRTTLGAHKRLVEIIGERVSNFHERCVIIAHCFDAVSANQLKEMIIEKYNFINVRIQEMKGLCSFYSLERGILVSF